MQCGLLAILLVLVGDSADAPITLRLKEQASVQGPLIHLSDVADIRAADPEMQRTLAERELGPSPPVSESLWLDASRIKDVLYRQGVATSEIAFSGANKVEVRLKQAGESPRPESTPSVDWRKIIHRMLLSDVLASEDWPADEVTVQFEGNRAIEFLEKNRPKNWRIEPPKAWRHGTQGVTLTIPPYQGSSNGDEQASSRFTLQVTVLCEKKAVVARRNIERGEIIAAQDVELSSVKRPQGNSPRFERLDQVVGMEAKKALPAGRPIAQDDVRGKPVVFRGSPVTVWVRHGTATIKLVFTAVDDGAVGDWIEVINPESRQKLQQKVRVMAPQTAMLLAESPPANSAGRFTNPKTTARETSGRLAKRGNGP